MDAHRKDGKGYTVTLTNHEYACLVSALAEFCRRHEHDEDWIDETRVACALTDALVAAAAGAGES